MGLNIILKCFGIKWYQKCKNNPKRKERKTKTQNLLKISMSTKNSLLMSEYLDFAFYFNIILLKILIFNEN